MPNNQKVYKVDETKFKVSLSTRLLNQVMVSKAFNKNETYISNVLRRQNGAFPETFICFLEKTYGIKRSEIGAVPYENLQKRKNLVERKAEPRVPVCKDKIKKIIQEAHETMESASKKMGFNHAYLALTFIPKHYCENGYYLMPASGVRRFNEVFGVVTEDYAKAGFTPPHHRRFAQRCCYAK